MLFVINIDYPLCSCGFHYIRPMLTWKFIWEIRVYSSAVLEPIRQVQRVIVPYGAPAAIQAFAEMQATLANARAQIHNQLLESLPAGASQQQIVAMEQQEQEIFHQQYAGDLQLQSERATALAAELESQPIRIPGPPAIPPGATPQVQAFLTSRNALAKEMAQLWNQYIDSTPAARQSAMDQWQQQNAGRLQQLSQLAASASNSTPNQQQQNQ